MTVEHRLKSKWVLKGYASFTRNGRFLRLMCYHDVRKRDLGKTFYMFREDIEALLNGKRKVVRVFTIEDILGC